MLIDIEGFMRIRSTNLTTPQMIGQHTSGDLKHIAPDMIDLTVVTAPDQSQEPFLYEIADLVTIRNPL